MDEKTFAKGYDGMKNCSYLKGIMIAHRGIFDNKKIPENSMKAFSYALELGYAIELDVHILKDNNIIVFHDDNLKRMTGIDKDLKNCTYDEIKHFTLLNSKERIPLLCDVLKQIDGKVLLDIELKFDTKIGRLEKKLMEMLMNYHGDYVVKSFHPCSILWFKHHYPNVIRGQLGYGYQNKKLSFFSRYFMSHMLTTILTKPDFIAYGLDGIPCTHIKKKRKKGIPILIWNIHSEQDLQRAKKFGDGFICDGIDFKRKR